jgi:NhaP-type Na+/H+ or K+/H+ antiporter
MGLAVGGGFSLSGAMLDLFKQAAIGVLAGAVLGYLAALLIAHERWAVLAEYASEVTLAFIGALFCHERKLRSLWRFSCSASSPACCSEAGHPAPIRSHR